MERKREGTSRHYRTAATPLAEAIAAGVTFPQGVGHMNAERMLIVSVALLALGLGLIFGSAGFSAAYPASGASFQLSLTTTGIPAEAGVAATVFGIVLLLAAFLQAIVEQVRWPHQASKHHGSTAT
jgi:TRAP-type C4-dicarboxylate transport system permease small subunit